MGIWWFLVNVENSIGSADNVYPLEDQLFHNDTALLFTLRTILNTKYEYHPCFVFLIFIRSPCAIYTNAIRLLLESTSSSDANSVAAKLPSVATNAIQVPLMISANELDSILSELFDNSAEEEIEKKKQELWNNANFKVTSIHLWSYLLFFFSASNFL